MLRSFKSLNLKEDCRHNKCVLNKLQLFLAKHCISEGLRVGQGRYRESTMLLIDLQEQKVYRQKTCEKGLGDDRT